MAPAQSSITKDSLRLAAVLDSIRTAIGATGASAAVIFSDGSVWRGVSGYAWERTPVTSATTFDIGSVTEPFTAALILQLVGDGAMRLDDSVARWLPEAPHIEGVTVRQLLRHMSGIADYTAHPGFMAAIRAGMAGPWPPEKNLRFVGPSVSPPDSIWNYSNTNYTLLGLIAGKAGNASCASLLHGRVLARLGLHNTFVAGEDSITSPRAHAYVDFTNDGKPDDLSSVVPDNAMTRGSGGAGAVLASASDVATFARAYFTGMLSGPELHRLATDWRDRGDGMRYGFGVIANPKSDGLLLGHLGNTVGHSAGVWHSLEGGVTAVLLANVHGVRMGGPVEALLRAAISSRAR